MKITDFFVSGFGIFSGSGARLSGGLTVFQGENESGKTTLMNFFRRLLFSRGKNGRGKTNLYEPQRGGQHGGSARIRMEDGREYILSVEGQKNYIAPADGGPAAELSPDFFSISREVYESVFAMGLGEMQSLDPLNSSDVAARFFAAGAGLGSASLPRLLSVLEARQNELYRPWGNARSASTVNRLLASMAETDGAVRDLRELNGSWRRMKDDLSAMEASMEEKKERLDVLKRRTARLELLEKARPSREALVETERKLAGLEGLHPFPDDGLSRLE
ncbi:MAG TPA: AAA family ATPase, partial [Aminivibrio sp.]|nr:AAA family ATPase [Aminivibrio sp.]